MDRIQNHLISLMKKAIVVYQDDQDSKNELDFFQKTVEYKANGWFPFFRYNICFPSSSPAVVQQVTMTGSSTCITTVARHHLIAVGSLLHAVNRHCYGWMPESMTVGTSRGLMGYL